MASTAPLVLALSFWLFVYIRRRYVLSNANLFLLPVTTSVHPHRASRVLWTLGRYTEVDLTSHFVLRGRTLLFVDRHTSLLEILGVNAETTSVSRRRPAKQTKCCGQAWGSIVRSFYNLGSVTAVVGQMLAVTTLWWSLVQLGLHLLDNTEASPVIPHNMVKRNLMSILQRPSDSRSSFQIRPLIPGVNLPLSHLFPIFLALVVCTTIHELGHAIAAAADGVPLVSWGYSLILVIPAAFVELATGLTATKERTSLARLRISSSGVYHNLITLLVLSLISNISIDQVIWPLFGYREIGGGVVVVDIHVSSPLRPYLLPGSIVTRLDDAELSKSSTHSPHDLWSSVLLMDTVEYQEGWCVDRRWLEDHSQGCCSLFSVHDKKQDILSCFIPRSSSLISPEDGWCIDPVPLFEDQTKQRCVSHATCDAPHKQDSLSSNAGESSAAEKKRVRMCIAPHSSAALLRISVLMNAGDMNEKTIVWKGPRREVWEQVTIGKYLPRFRILPLALPRAIGLVLEYLRTVSLSLFFLNLLPVRFLDGGEVLCASLALVSTVTLPWDHQGMTTRHGDTDLEIGPREWSNQPPPWRRRAQQVERIVEMMTAALMGIIFICGLLVLGVG